MKRVWLAALTAALCVGLAGLAGLGVLWEREYQNLLNRGNGALAAGQTYQAIEAFSGAIALREDAMIAYLKRGEAYLQRGESGAALRDLRTAARLDPAAVRPAELLGDVNYTLERYARAAEAYRTFVAIDDRSPRVLYKLGLSLFRAGDAQAAVAPLRGAIALDDKLAEAYYVLGLCLKEQRLASEAIQAFETSARLNPAMVPSREELAGAYAAAGRPRQAVEQLEAIAALEPGRAERQTAVALAYAREGRTDTAVNILGRAAERYPDNTGVFLALARIWLDVAEPRRDRLALRKALEAVRPLARRPSASSDALGLYGRALLLSGDTVAAEDVLRQACRTFPLRLEALLWHADAAERLGRMQVARESLERWSWLAPDGTPNRAAVLERLGTAALRMGDTPAAIRSFTQATQAENAPASSWAGLARAQIAAGITTAAAQTITSALVLFPRDAALSALARQTRARAPGARP